MWRSVRLILIASTAAAAGLGCEPASAPTAPRPLGPSASAGVRRIVLVQLHDTFTLTNLCTQEMIPLTPTEETRITEIIDGAGGTHTIVLDKVVAEGVSNLGTTYRAMQVSPAILIQTPGGTFVQTVPFRLRIIGEGPGQDVTIDALLHITEVDGQPVAHVETFATECLFPPV